MKFNISRKTNLVEVKDGCGNSTMLPHCGSFNYKEEQVIEEVIKTSVNENYRANYVAAIIKERLKKTDPEIVNKTAEQILSDEETGEPIPYSLLEAMYNFFDSERRQWEPDNQQLVVTGKDAVEIATKYAEDNNLAAVQRSDMTSNNIVFVVENVDEMEKISQLHRLTKQDSVRKLIESGDYDVSKIIELNSKYYEWIILANHLPEAPAKKQPKQKALTGTETSGS